MPFDRILVTMDVAAIYKNGVDLTFDYFLLENNQIARKLAHGKHTMAWVGRDARNEPVALELPKNVVEALSSRVQVPAEAEKAAVLPPPQQNAGDQTEAGSPSSVSVRHLRRNI
jgi:hypothetical protein